MKEDWCYRGANGQYITIDLKKMELTKQLLIMIFSLWTVKTTPAKMLKEGIHQQSGKTLEIIQGQYIIAIQIPSKLARERKDSTEDFVEAFRNKCYQVTQMSTVGQLSFAFFNGTDEELLEIENMPEVRYIEPNYLVRATGCDSDTVGSLWGLDRIDQRGPVEPYITPEYRYSGSNDGTGVTVYVVDSGIDVGLSEFGGRARRGYTASGMDGDVDLNGHGTHVAGTIGSRTYGVAKKPELVAVKVLNQDGDGSIAGIIQALQWVENDYILKGRSVSVMNLSLGSAASVAFDEALNAVIEAWIPAVVAAGNDYEDACFSSPARLSRAITVGALNDNDILPAFTNYGRCLDIFAPGVNILSTYPSGLGLPATAILSGTSMATPHVTGVLARYLSSNISTIDSTAWLLAMATRDSIIFEYDWEATSPDRLLYINCPDDNGGQWNFSTPTPPNMHLPDNGVDSLSISLTVVTMVAMTNILYLKS